MTHYVDETGAIVDADRFYAKLKPQEEIAESANSEWRRLLNQLVADEKAARAAAMAAISQVTAPLEKLRELLSQQWGTTEPTCRTKRS